MCIRFFLTWTSLANSVLVLGSKEAEEEAEQAEKNLEIALRLIIDTQGWGGIVWKVVQGVTQVGVEKQTFV